MRVYFRDMWQVEKYVMYKLIFLVFRQLKMLIIEIDFKFY